MPISFGLDQSLYLIAITIMGIGLITVYSASFIFASETYADSLYFFKRQVFFCVLGIVAMGFTSRVPYLLLKKLFWVFWSIMLILLLAVFIPGLGVRVGGALRWIALPGGFRLEPSEFAKLMSPVIAAYLLLMKREPGTPIWQTGLKVALIAGVPLYLLMKHSDFGSMVIFFLVAMTVFFCFGLPLKYLIGLVVASIPTVYFLVFHVAYRRERVMAFLNPWSDPSNSGFQVIQSLLGIQAGGFWGVGLGEGQAKLFFLPEAHTDFIMTVLGEEMGFVGILVVLLLFLILFYRGLQIAMKCKDPFGQRLALGLTCLLGFSALINLGVVTGLLPTKGLTMPLLSYGGSSMLATCLACGVLINIHRLSVKNSGS